MKYQLSILLLSLSLGQNIAAYAEPISCPKLSVLKQTTFTHVDMDQWTADAQGYFGTQEKWDFFISTFGVNEKAALKKAYSNLALLSESMGPRRNPEHKDEWMCAYFSPDKKIIAGAITPAFEDINQRKNALRQVA